MAIMYIQEMEELPLDLILRLDLRSQKENKGFPTSTDIIMDAAIRMDCPEIALYEGADLSPFAAQAKMEFLKQKKVKIYGMQPLKPTKTRAGFSIIGSG